MYRKNGIVYVLDFTARTFVRVRFVKDECFDSAEYADVVRLPKLPFPC